MNLKFKYCFNGFFKQDVEEVDIDTGERFKPYENLDVIVMYFSVAFNLFRNFELNEDYEFIE
ncbi:MAG: hypothetical protein KFF73_17075 [Cyclobacteriaceae bacterium]|nr:hypothetical protein [Cyclobacteriaceae bacterium]